jgi:hypothetical protein
MDIAEKIEKLTALNVNINEYSNKLLEFHEKNIFNVDITKELAQLNKNIDLIKTDTTQRGMFKMWHLINHSVYIISTIIDELDEVLQNHSKKIVFDMSDTFIDSLNDLYTAINIMYVTYKRQTDNLDISIIIKLSNDVKNAACLTTDTIINNANKFTDLVKEYPFAVSLYAYIMQSMITDCKTTGRETCVMLLNIIESVKTEIMVPKSSNNTAHLYKRNPHLKTFGLTPTGTGVPLLEITKNIFNSTDSLKRVASSNNVCIVVISKVINKPIEFSIWNLIDWKLIQKYAQDENMGINTKLIEKLNTIKFNTIKKQQKWDFSVQYHGDINSDTFYIIENIGGGLYRRLKHKLDIEKISRQSISSFIDHVKNKGVSKNNTRISEYNIIQERAILKNMFLPIKFDITSINVNSQVIDSKYIRNIIYVRLIKQFDKEYTKSKIKNNAGVGKLIHSPMLYTIFNSILIEQYNIYTFKNKENVSGFPLSETLKSFLAQLHHLSTQFSKDIHDEFTIFSIDKTIYDDENRKKTYLKTMFSDILKKILEKIITNESNVYQSLIYKTNLLNLSVV